MKLRRRALEMTRMKDSEGESALRLRSRRKEQGRLAVQWMMMKSSGSRGIVMSGRRIACAVV